MSRPSVNCFIKFDQPTNSYALPERFTFPFYYEPHPLSVLAATELQQHLENQTEWDHNFGIEEGKQGLVIGKMFGVLVVRNEAGELGYLAAFSGKLAGQNHHAKFVPPVFDILTDDGFFRRDEEVINKINFKIEQLEKEPAFLTQQELLQTETERGALAIEELKRKIKAGKHERKHQREQAHDLSEEDINNLLERLRQESVREQFQLKDLTRWWKNRLQEIQQQIDEHLAAIQQLKEERKSRSADLQKRLFDEYYFLNQEGKKKSLLEIFEHTIEAKPPAGAGECAAPKLLQYAFLNNLKPIAMAEFWWGQSPKSEVRVHGQFYPACRGKCEPILAHMLDGMEVDENPMLVNQAQGKDIEIVYEDETMLVINKPAEFLSVPGKNVQDSVYERIKQKYPKATGPLIVHRLDMSTSGLMLIAKTKETHQILQEQFIKRSIKKRYVALLDGFITGDEGFINLPLRVDLDNRPQQLVCYEYGKTAHTKWKVLERTNQQTRIQFYPITGRTHQLRVHAAHALGLNSPIVGDDLYGNKGERLHLHAEWIEFKHPVNKETMQIQVEADF